MMHHSKMKKILITGSSGYIGTNLCHLLKDKYIIHGIDIKKPVIKIQDFKQESIISAKISQEYHAVIHLAALIKVSESVDKPWEYYDVNVNGTQNLINQFKGNFVFASTGGIYGDTANPYSISKHASEFIVKKINKYSIFRIFNVVGGIAKYSDNQEGIICKLEEACKTGSFTIYGNNLNTTDGTPIRHYIHVHEVCNAIEMAIENPTNSIEDLAHKKPLSVLETAEIYKKQNNKEFQIKYGQKRQGDPEKISTNNISKYMKEIYTKEQLFSLQCSDFINKLMLMSEEAIEQYKEQPEPYVWEYKEPAPRYNRD